MMTGQKRLRIHCYAAMDESGYQHLMQVKLFSQAEMMDATFVPGQCAHQSILVSYTVYHTGTPSTDHHMTLIHRGQTEQRASEVKVLAYPSTHDGTSHCPEGNLDIQCSYRAILLRPVSYMYMYILRHTRIIQQVALQSCCLASVYHQG